MISIKVQKNEKTDIKIEYENELQLANDVGNIIISAYKTLRSNYSKKDAITIMEYIINKIKRGDFDVR